MNVGHTEGILIPFLSKIFFYDKMDFRLFYFHMTICCDWMIKVQ